MIKILENKIILFLLLIKVLLIIFADSLVYAQGNSKQIKETQMMNSNNQVTNIKNLPFVSKNGADTSKFILISSKYQYIMGQFDSIGEAKRPGLICSTSQ